MNQNPDDKTNTDLPDTLRTELIRTKAHPRKQPLYQNKRPKLIKKDHPSQTTARPRKDIQNVQDLQLIDHQSITSFLPKDNTAYYGTIKTPEIRPGHNNTYIGHIETNKLGKRASGTLDIKGLTNHKDQPLNVAENAHNLSELTTKNITTSNEINIAKEAGDFDNLKTSYIDTEDSVNIAEKTDTIASLKAYQMNSANRINIACRADKLNKAKVSKIYTDNLNVGNETKEIQSAEVNHIDVGTVDIAVDYHMCSGRTDTTVGSITANHINSEGGVRIAHVEKEIGQVVANNIKADGPVDLAETINGGINSVVANNIDSKGPSEIAKQFNAYEPVDSVVLNNFYAEPWERGGYYGPFLQSDNIQSVHINNIQQGYRKES